MFARKRYVYLINCESVFLYNCFIVFIHCFFWLQVNEFMLTYKEALRKKNIEAMKSAEVVLIADDDDEVYNFLSCYIRIYIYTRICIY